LKTAQNNIEKKREVISTMFPEKLHFENSSLGTDRINEAVKCIYWVNTNLGGNKRGQNRNKSVLSSI
jgi:site-specific DNA recombinase